MQDYGSILIQTNSADRAHKYSQIMFFIRGSGCDKGLTLKGRIMLTNGWAESIVAGGEKRNTALFRPASHTASAPPQYPVSTH